MTSHRLRWGALAWLLTLQFFVIETLVQLQQDLPYSRVHDVISALGAGTSPAAALMNASFVAQAGLILAGALALRPLLNGVAGRIAVVLLSLTAVGVLVVGVFPQDTAGPWHTIGAAAYLGGGALGLIALAYAVRARSEALGTALALLGLLGAAASIFFVMAVTALLGEGGTERVAAYVLPLGLALAGLTLWRGGAGPGAESDGARTRREQRDSARAERAARARERDEALQASVRHEAPTPGTTTPGGSSEPDHPRDADDPEDPWASPARRED